MEKYKRLTIGTQNLYGLIIFLWLVCVAVLVVVVGNGSSIIFFGTLSIWQRFDRCSHGNCIHNNFLPLGPNLHNF